MVKPVLDEAMKLSPDDRLNLIEALWESLSPEDVDLTPAQRAEVERRLADHHANPDDVLTWDEIKARVLRRG